MAQRTVSELKVRLATAEGALRRSAVDVTVGKLALEIRNHWEALSNLTVLARQEADKPDKVRTYLELAACRRDTRGSPREKRGSDFGESL